jgi:hypothetical protein
MGLLHRVGRRGGALVAFALLCFVYSFAIISGWHPAFAEDIIISIQDFGWIWFGVGTISLIGAVLPRDEIAFAIDVFWVVAWICFILFRWSGSFGWTEAISWGGLLLFLFISAGWPENE